MKFHTRLLGLAFWAVCCARITICPQRDSLVQFYQPSFGPPKVACPLLATLRTTTKQYARKAYSSLEGPHTFDMYQCGFCEWEFHFHKENRKNVHVLGILHQFN